MPATSFKELQVWQRAVELVVLIYGITKSLPRTEAYGLGSQMQRAVVSIPSNISEGYSRKNRKEYIQFCSIAFGSAAELETQLVIVERLYPLAKTTKAAAHLTEVQKMLYALIQKLKLHPNN